MKIIILHSQTHQTHRTNQSQKFLIHQSAIRKARKTSTKHLKIKCPTFLDAFRNRPYINETHEILKALDEILICTQNPA